MPERREIDDAVRSRYAQAAVTASTCGPATDGFGPDETVVYGAARYDDADLEGLPGEAVAASIGCANPVALAELQAGETVLDLGSGGGIDVLLSARRVGPTGMAYGVDMTDEMLALARANQERAGITNAKFLRGRIEDVPLPDESVDVIVSNCVINLSADKPEVFAEAHRVLRRGGRLAIADVVADGPVGEDAPTDLAAWTDCIAGAVTRDDYRSMLQDAGFVDITIDDSHPVADGYTSVIVRAATMALPTEP